MAEKKTRGANSESALENRKWRLTCVDIGKGKEIEGLDAGKNKIDTNNTNFLEDKGAEKNQKGDLILKVGNCRVESETIRGKKVVLRRIDENGKVMYENEELAKDTSR